MNDGDNKVITESSGNIFADLELDNSDELYAKSILAGTIRDIIRSRNLKQTEAAELLGTHQTHISRLSSGSGIEKMTFDLLLSWLTKLDRNIVLTVKKTSRNCDSGCINVAV